MHRLYNKASDLGIYMFRP